MWKNRKIGMLILVVLIICMLSACGGMKADEIIIPHLEYERGGDVVALVYINADCDGCYIASDENTIDLSIGEPEITLANQSVFDLFYEEVDTSSASLIIAYNWRFYAVEDIDGELFVSGLDGIYMSFNDFCYSAVKWQQKYPTAIGGLGLA